MLCRGRRGPMCCLWPSSPALCCRCSRARPWSSPLPCWPPKVISTSCLSSSRRRLGRCSVTTRPIHGVWIIIVARFIRGGRTATTYLAGTVGMPWKRQFLPADAIAAATWSLYASALGSLGGASFEDNFWLPMLIGAGASLLVGPSGNWCVARCSTEARRRETAHPALDRRAAPRRRNARLRTSGCRPRVQRQRSTLSAAPRAAPPGDGAAGPLRDSELSHCPSAIYVFATCLRSS